MAEFVAKIQKSKLCRRVICEILLSVLIMLIITWKIF